MEFTLEHGVDHLEGLVDLLPDLCARQDDLARHEDEQHDLGLDHAIDQTREQLRLVRAEVVMLGSQTLEADGELDVARADNVLDLEVGELGIEAELLDDARILARRQLRVILRLCARDDHLARGEDERRGFRLADTHDHGGETLETRSVSKDESMKNVRAPLPRSGVVSSTFGLYSAFLACSAIVLRSSRQSRLTVATIFL